MNIRKILHLDLDAFFCAVEEQRDPSLIGKPFAVGGQPDQRGVVASCSYPARKLGVRSAMPMWRAVRLCPDLIIVQHHFDLYHTASHQVMEILQNFTPLVEQLSIDEAFLDVSLRLELGVELAHQIQTAIRQQVGLPSSLGVASNKLVAKIANNIGKSHASPGVTPNAITEVLAGHEAEFLAPLPIIELWGVGPKTAARLEVLGLHTIGDIARLAESDLSRRLGKHGRDLHRRAQGIDDAPVQTEREAKSISQEITFSRDVSDRQKLSSTLRKLSEGVGKRLRHSGLQGNTVHLKLRWADFTTLTRQETLRQPTDLDIAIYSIAERLFESNWIPGKKVRLIGVGVSGFEAGTWQAGLWENDIPQTRRHLQSALDDLRDRYGDESVRWGMTHKSQKRNSD
jgi:DNA polymerase-4